MIEKLEGASKAVTKWIDSIEAAGQSDSLHLIQRKDLKTVKKSVKNKFKANQAWKRARMKTKAIQHWSAGDKNLQDALRNVQKKQMSMERLVEAGEDYDSFTL